MGLIAYMVISLGGITHVDLLLDNKLTLPIVGVEIPLTGFAGFAPALLLLVHVGLLIQHVLLGFKYREFNKALSNTEAKFEFQHPDRHLVHNYMFAQLVGGPLHPPMLVLVMRASIVVTFIFAPVFVFLFFQITFLPIHNEWLTGFHRAWLLADISALAAAAPFFQFANVRWSGKKYPTNRIGKLWGTSLPALWGGLAVIAISFSGLVATIPGEPFDNWISGLPSPLTIERGDRKILALTSFLFEGEIPEDSDRPNSWFTRNIVVVDTDLVSDRETGEGEVTLRLRHRDLRYAILDRSDLHQADLSGANMRGVSAQGVNFQGAVLQRTNLNEANLRFANFEGANLQRVELVDANLQYANLLSTNFECLGPWSGDSEETQATGCSNLSGADLRNAWLQYTNLRGANMVGVWLQNATLDFADLSCIVEHVSSRSSTDLKEYEYCTDLSDSIWFSTNAEFINLAGVDLVWSTINWSDLSFSELRQVEAIGANMDGTQFVGANFFQSDFTAASLVSANLTGASLDAANFRGSNLDGAKLSAVSFDFDGTFRLRDPDFSGASLDGANFWGAEGQMRSEDMAIDLSEIDLSIEIARREALAAIFRDGTERLEMLLDNEEIARPWFERTVARNQQIVERLRNEWASEDEWRDLVQVTISNPIEEETLADVMAQFACSDASGHVVFDPLDLFSRSPGLPSSYARALLSRSECPSRTARCDINHEQIRTHFFGSGWLNIIPNLPPSDWPILIPDLIPNQTD